MWTCKSAGRLVYTQPHKADAIHFFTFSPSLREPEQSWLGASAGGKVPEAEYYTAPELGALGDLASFTLHCRIIELEVFKCGAQGETETNCFCFCLFVYIFTRDSLEDISMPRQADDSMGGGALRRDQTHVTELEEVIFLLFLQ